MPFIITVPSVWLEMLSLLSKTISFPVTVRSPLTFVVVAVIRTVPSLALVIVSSFSSIIPVDPVTSKLVLAVMVVKAPDEAELDPIGLPLTDPPEMVKSSSTLSFAIAVARQVPDVTEPTVARFAADVNDPELPVVITVPVASGKVIVLSEELGSVIAKDVS